MEARYLARGLRARPTPWLFASRQQSIMQQTFLQTLRYNSSNNTNPTPQPTATPTATETPSKSPAPKSTLHLASDFDEILNKLDLGSKTRPEDNAQPIRPGPGPLKPAQSTISPGPELKLGPSLGRQVYVEAERGVDLPAAIRILEQTCSANQVRHQANKQKFHVRKGMLRKEQRRTRWRKLFKFSFKATVKKIQRMQAQGW